MLAINIGHLNSHHAYISNGVKKFLCVSLSVKKRTLSNLSSLDHKILRYFEEDAKDDLPKKCAELESDPTLKILSRSAKTIKQQAGALVPICTVHGRPSLLFNVRSQNLRNHRGDISFPGGMKSDEDLSIEDAALRETEEELAISRNEVKILSSLQPFVNTKRTVRITAVFGFIGDLEMSDLVLSDNEVADAFTVPIAELQCAQNSRYTMFRTGWSLPVFLSGQHHIWGITASITDMLLSMITPMDYSRKFYFNRVKIENSYIKNHARQNAPN